MKIAEKTAKRIEKYYKKRAGRSLYFYPLAVYYFNARKFDVAYQILLDGIQSFPRYCLALLKIGEILVNEGSYESAVFYLETAVNIEKTCEPALELLALCYEKTNNLKKAKAIYEKLVFLGNEGAKTRLIELAGRLKPEKKEIESIVDELGEGGKIPRIELEEDEEENAEEEEATITLAKLYEKQGYINDAIDVYKKILKREPDNVEAKEALERLLNDVGLEEGEKE